jgi:hypothetical protein
MEYKIVLLSERPEDDSGAINTLAGQGWEVQEFFVVPLKGENDAKVYVALRKPGGS